MTMSKLTDRDARKVNEEIRKVRELIKLIDRAGGKVPPLLTKVLKQLQIALDTGHDLGTAFEEAHAALAALDRDLLKACRDVDDAMQLVCEAKVSRLYQARALSFTLNYRNPKSVTSQFLKKTIQRYTPARICQHWAYCRKQVEK